MYYGKQMSRRPINTPQDKLEVLAQLEAPC